MIFPGFPGVLSFFQVFQVEWEPSTYFIKLGNCKDDEAWIVSHSYLLLMSTGKSREILVSHILSLQSSPPETSQNR